MSTASIWDPVRPVGLVPEYRGTVYLTNAYGEKASARDITDRVQACSVSVNWLGDIKSTMRVQLTEPVMIRPLIDFIMPCVSITWRNSEGRTRRILEEPLGVFTFLMPDQEVGEYVTTSLIEGMDGLFLLSQLTSDKLFYFDTGTDFGAAAREIVAGQTFGMRLTLPDTGRTMEKPATVRANEYLIKRMNEFYDSGEFWDLAPTRYGNITTFERTVLGNSEPERVLRSDDVLGTIRLSPQRDAFCNQVFLTSNSPSADVILRDGYKVSFVDPESPFSTVNAAVISKSLSDSRDESFQTMRNRAILMLESAAGLQERIVVPHVPDPRFDIREAWELDISQGNGRIVAKGMYRVEAMEFGMTPSDFAQVTTLSHLVNTEAFFEG